MLGMIQSIKDHQKNSANAPHNMRVKVENLGTKVVDGVTVIQTRRTTGKAFCKRCFWIRQGAIILGGTFLIWIVTEHFLPF